MFNDDGLGQAMEMSAVRTSALEAQKKSIWLEENLIECMKRVMELQAQVSYLMRRDVENQKGKSND